MQKSAFRSRVPAAGPPSDSRSERSATLEARDEKELCSREPGAAVLSALRQLLSEDAYLLENDANERSISHRFGIYLQLQLPQWHVDCEYNRDGVEPKRIRFLGLSPDDEDTEGRTVFPDIVAHIRDTRQNYLVIEIKKSTSTVDRSVDFDKLRRVQTEPLVSIRSIHRTICGRKERRGYG